MAGSLRVELVSPERVVYSGEASMVIVRTVEGGDIAFQPGHAPFLGALVERASQIHLLDGSVVHVAIHGGFVEVSGDVVSILSDGAELAELIDVDRARAAMEEAERRMGHEADAVGAAAIRRATARLNAVANLPAGEVGRAH